MEGLSCPSAALGNLVCSVPLVLEVSGLDVPFIDFARDSVQRHDPLHKRHRDSGGKEANEDVVVCDAGTGNVALEAQDVTLKGGRELSILLGHAVGQEPGDVIPRSVLVFECCLKCSEEIISCP